MLAALRGLSRKSSINAAVLLDSAVDIKWWEGTDRAEGLWVLPALEQEIPRDHRVTQLGPGYLRGEILDFHEAPQLLCGTGGVAEAMAVGY